MIPLPMLRRRMDGDWVVFAPDGGVAQLEVPGDAGPATLLVSPVTEALKRVERGRVVESIDRNGMWRVDAVILNRVVLERLEDGDTTLDELMDSVRAAGFAWQIIPSAAP